MLTVSTFARTAAVMGDPGRAAMLWTLMDGRALAAGELARVAGISNSTASEHLAALRDAGLVTRIVNGRHHYYRLASASVASLLESVMSLTSENQQLVHHAEGRIMCGPRDPSLRRLRRCYDHLAGEIAVRIADVMVERGQLCIGNEAALVTCAGTDFLCSLGVSIDETRSTYIGARARLCRPCLDWSERRYHIAGWLGIELYRVMETKRWFHPEKRSRSLHLTRLGDLGLEQYFGIRADII